MATATLTNVTKPTDDAIIGIGRALSYYEEQLEKNPTPPADLLADLRAAQAWLMTINHEIHLDNVANDR